MSRLRLCTTVAVSATAVLGLAACGSAATSGGSGGSGGAAATAAAAGGVNLADVCPATVVIQTDWNPEADHGHAYQLVGPNPSIDAGKKSVTGDLYAKGAPTGVKVEVRAGGPAIGFQSVSSTMYSDKSILLGYVTTDEGVSNSSKLPTTAVFAENDISPQMIMWDPSVYPNVTDIKSLGAALPANGGVVRYFKGAAYMDYLTGSKILDKASTDGGYDGTPAQFVAAKGKDAQQGFATAEPYIYKNEVKAWGKDVKFQLIYDTGYPVYPEAMAVRTADLEKNAACLKKLVPVLQQADVDYIKSPDTTNALIVDLVTKYNNGWVYSKGVADYAVKQMKDLGIAKNGPSGYVGEMTAERIQKVIDIDTPIFTAQNAAPKSGLKAADLFTIDYLDKSIKF